MEKVVMNAAYTAKGYSCNCDLLPGWVVAFSGDFEGFRQYVQESIDFYVDGARQDGTAYPQVFDGEYEVVFKFDIVSLLAHYKGPAPSLVVCEVKTKEERVLTDK